MINNKLTLIADTVNASLLIFFLGYTTDYNLSIEWWKRCSWSDRRFLLVESHVLSHHLALT